MPKLLEVSNLTLTDCDCGPEQDIPEGEKSVHFILDGIVHHGALRADNKVEPTIRLIPKASELILTNCLCDPQHQNLPSYPPHKRPTLVHFELNDVEYHGVKIGDRVIPQFKVYDIPAIEAEREEEANRNNKKKIKKTELNRIREKRKVGSSLTQEEETFLLDALLGV